MVLSKCSISLALLPAQLLGELCDSNGGAAPHGHGVLLCSCRVCIVSSDTDALSDVGAQASIHTSPGCHAPQRCKDDLQLHVTTLINEKTRAFFEVYVQQDACASALPCSAERHKCPVMHKHLTISVMQAVEQWLGSG